MSEITLSATAGADGRLHFDIPAEAGEYEVRVTLTPKPAGNGTGRKPTPQELGWPQGFFENVCGSIDDDTFVRPPQLPFPPPLTWEDPE